MQLHETRYGAKFFDGQLPKLWEIVPVGAWALIDRYGELLAAGLACPAANNKEVCGDGKS